MSDDGADAIVTYNGVQSNWSGEPRWVEIGRQREHRKIREFEEQLRAACLASANDRCGVAKNRDFNHGYVLGIEECIRQALGVLYSYLPET